MEAVRDALICSNLNDLLLFNCLITHRTIKSIIGLIVGQMKPIEAVTGQRVASSLLAPPVSLMAQIVSRRLSLNYLVRN